MLYSQTRCIICLEDWPKFQIEEDKKAKEAQPVEELKSHGESRLGGLEDIWASNSKEIEKVNEINEIVNRLIPCDHLECNTCFVNYHQK